MRDIKFRVWNMDEYISLSEALYDFEVVGTQTNKSEIESWYDGVVIEQYTGLKDKNGKEIYEGDIIRIPAKDKFEETNFLAFEIFYHDNDCAPNSCIGFKIGRMKTNGSVCGGFCGYNLLPKTTAKFEIIGNIHENPGLLKEK